MSIESLKARLGAATPGPWDGTKNDDPTDAIPWRWLDADGRNGDFLEQPDEELVRRAPTDLTVALAVIEAVKAMIATGDGEVRCPNCGRHEHRDDCELLALTIAYEAFEALP